MSKLEESLSKKVTVINELGMHARPAAKVAELAAKATSNVWMIKNKEKVDASSIIDILSLCCTKGSQVTLQIDNPADKAILKEIADLFEIGFKEL